MEKVAIETRLPGGHEPKLSMSAGAIETIAPARQAAERLPILGSVRKWLWLPLVLAAGNGFFLYFLPWLAETLYAWSIKPPVNAAFMGAGYLTGVVACALAVFAAKYWRSVRPLVLPFGLLGIGLFGATILHADKFFWTYPLTWIWTLIYFILPPGVAIVWIAHERVPTQFPAADPRLSAVRWVCWPLGVVLVVGGVFVYFAPESIANNWPWQVTPLLLRCFASWYLLMGTTLLFVAVTTRRAHEIVVPGLSIGAFNLFLLLLPFIYAGSMNFGSTSFWLWLGLHTALLIACAFTVMWGWKLLQSERTGAGWAEV